MIQTKIHSGRKLPIKSVDRRGKEIARYKSINDAAAAVGCYPNAIRCAVETGTRCRCFWWRYSDMPDSAQPLKVGRKDGPHEIRGKRFKTLDEAARYFGISVQGVWSMQRRDSRRQIEEVACATTG